VICNEKAPLGWSGASLDRKEGEGNDPSSKDPFCFSYAAAAGTKVV